MAVMAKKSKKAKSATEPTVEAAAGDLEVQVAPEPAEEKPEKKRKKAKAEKADTNGDAVGDLETNGDLEPAEKPEKKKKKGKKAEKADTNGDVIVNGNTDDKNNIVTNGVKAVVEEPSETVLEAATDEKPGVKAKGSVVKSAKIRMKEDLAYMTDFMSFLHIPQHRRGDEEEEGRGELSEEVRERLFLNKRPGERAASREELQDRLKKKMEELRGSFGPNDKKKAKKLKRRMAALEKGKDNNELKQKLMEIGINAGKKSQTIAKEVESMGGSWQGGKVTKPGVKTDKGVVFSKFDFQEMEKEKKKTLDPATALKKIQKSKDKIKLWEEKGKTEKVKNIESSIAWDNALGKSQGEKIKDDETLLKKAIKKKTQIKGSKKKKWDARVEAVEHRKDGKQSKREENISKRKKDKKDKKKKHAVADGRHVPGF